MIPSMGIALCMSETHRGFALLITWPATYCRIGIRRHERSVDLVVKIGAHSDALAHHIVCREVDGQCTGTAGGLCRVVLDFAYQGGIVTQLEVELQRQVVAHTLLLGLQFKHRIEIGNLIPCSNDKRLVVGFDHLPCRRVEGQRAGITDSMLNVRLLFIVAFTPNKGANFSVMVTEEML